MTAATILEKKIRLNKAAGYADAAGIFASILCLIHCLALPLVLAMLPALGWAEDEWLHELLVGVAMVATLLALVPGFATHRRVSVLLMGIGGLACLAAAVFLVGPHFGEVAETALTVAGAVLLCAAHLRNRACCRLCVAELLAGGPRQ